MDEESRVIREDVEEGFFHVLLLQFVCSGQEGVGGCKGHPCTNKALPWDSGSL